MIIGRLIGYVFICLMLIVLGAEGLRYLEGNNEGFISLNQVFNFFFSDQINHLNAQISESAFPGVWGDIIVPMLNFSAFFSFLIVGIMLIFLSRDRLR